MKCANASGVESRKIHLSPCEGSQLQRSVDRSQWYSELLTFLPSRTCFLQYSIFSRPHPQSCRSDDGVSTHARCGLAAVFRSSRLCTHHSLACQFCNLPLTIGVKLYEGDERHV